MVSAIYPPIGSQKGKEGPIATLPKGHHQRKKALEEKTEDIQHKDSSYTRLKEAGTYLDLPKPPQIYTSKTSTNQTRKLKLNELS